MPKIVDYQARRLELAEALWRLTRAEGWEAISLRKVAAEAGVSVGMVQHSFKTTEQMLRFAVEMINEDVRSRIRQRIAELPQPHRPRQLVAAVLTEMIPDPGRRRTEAEAAAVFVRRFMLKPDSAAAMSVAGNELKNVLAEQIQRARTPNAPDEPAMRDAEGLIALLDGLIYNIVTGQQTADTARTIMRIQLDYVFGQE